jgi:hypothetical protein
VFATHHRVLGLLAKRKLVSIMGCFEFPMRNLNGWAALLRDVGRPGRDCLKTPAIFE